MYSATHQNVKLTLEGLELSQLVTDSDTHLSSYHDTAAMQNCCFSECKEWPGPLEVSDILENIFKESTVEIINS
jgi:hypothetical protein